jgi:hypothetical protein
MDWLRVGWETAVNSINKPLKTIKLYLIVLLLFSLTH